MIRDFQKKTVKIPLHIYEHTVLSHVSTEQSLCDPIDCSLPGSSIHGIFQVRILNPFPTPGIFPIEGLNPCLLHLLYWQADSLSLHLYIPLRMTKIPNTDNTKCWCRCGGVKSLIHCWWEWKWYSLWKQYCQFLNKVKQSTTPSCNCLRKYLPKGVENLCPHQNLDSTVCNSLIHNKIRSKQNGLQWVNGSNTVVHP